MVSFQDWRCFDHWQLEKIKGDGRIVLLPPNSMCSISNVRGGGGRICTYASAKHCNVIFGEKAMVSFKR